MIIISLNNISKEYNINLKDLILLKEFNTLYREIAEKKCPCVWRRQVTLNLLEEKFSQEEILKLKDVLSSISFYNYPEERKNAFWTEVEVRFLCAVLASLSSNINVGIKYVAKVLGRTFSEVQNQYYHNIKNYPEKLDTFSFIAITTQLIPVNIKVIRKHEIRYK